MTNQLRTLSLMLGWCLAAACAPASLPRADDPVPASGADLSFAAAPDLFFTFGDVRLRYRDVGRGEPLVLLHGWSRSLNDWHPIADSLASTHRVIALDWRGFGMSDKPAHPSRYGREMLDDVVRLLDHLEMRQAHFIGHSMGATGAAVFAVRHPQRVRTLVLAAGAFRDSSSLARRFTRWIEDLEQERGMEWALAGNSRDALIATLKNGPPSTAHAEAAAVRVPTLAIVGSEDFQAEDTRQLAGWWPGVRVVIVEGAGHSNILARPEFLAAVRAHIQSR